MKMNMRQRHHPLAGALCAVLLADLAMPASPARAADKPHWLAEEMPLPLSVRTPADLEFKAAVERQYLIFNLLAGGKWEWDQGHFAEAAKRWSALLRLPNLEPAVAKLLRPMLEQAERRADLPATAPTPDVQNQPVAEPVGAQGSDEEPAVKARASRLVTVSGNVQGGGSDGPGGAVIWLKRADGPTPKPHPIKHAHLNQLDKTFSPHVLTVTVGSTVTFENKDPILHDVFSLTKPNEFDSGLFDSSKPYQKVFRSAGAVQVLCNIHASMLGYIVVVDTPWYGQAGRDGRFHIRGVPPGKYQWFAWHEASSKVESNNISVGDAGVDDLTVRVGGDVRPANLVPDKYGKPRQRQLGY